MGEYWVSQPKHYCKVCNEWMADNKVTRQTHENGRKHKEKFALLQKERREARAAGLQNEREVREELQEIERAAQAALTQDRASGFFPFYAPQQQYPPAASFAAPQDHCQQQYQHPYHQHQHQYQYQALPQPAPPHSLAYEEQGQLYLSGPAHTTRLTPGSACEIWVGDANAWLRGRIAARADVRVPNTAIVLTSFEVTYSLGQEKEKEKEKEKGNGVGDESESATAPSEPGLKPEVGPEAEAEAETEAE